METTKLSASSGDWQERLAVDRQGGDLRTLRDHLARMRADLRRRLESGAPPQEYALCEKLLAAVEAADSAAVAFWEKWNKD